MLRYNIVCFVCVVTCHGGESGDARRPSSGFTPLKTGVYLAPFLRKTCDMVDDVNLDGEIFWGNNGSTFVIPKPEDFASLVLLIYFKHSNFYNFTRQLYNYVRTTIL